MLRAPSTSRGAYLPHESSDGGCGALTPPSPAGPADHDDGAPSCPEPRRPPRPQLHVEARLHDTSEPDATATRWRRPGTAPAAPSPTETAAVAAAVKAFLRARYAVLFLHADLPVSAWAAAPCASTTLGACVAHLRVGEVTGCPVGQSRGAARRSAAVPPPAAARPAAASHADGGPTMDMADGDADGTADDGYPDADADAIDESDASVSDNDHDHDHDDAGVVNQRDVDVVVHVYRWRSDRDLPDAGAVSDPAATERAGAAGDPEALGGLAELALPCAALDGAWEALLYDTPLQSLLLAYVQAAQLFAAHGVRRALIAWNRTVMLHGPPGTGKTSLCRALAHKLACRAAPTYPHAQLVELRAQQLLSKYFSESGTRVAQAFAAIRARLAAPGAFVIVVIDEVESVAAQRRSGGGTGNAPEPGDAVRVVNALLTELDALARAPNALVLMTSNLPDAVDAALLSRIDLMLYVSLPSRRAAYAILASCLAELVRCGMLAPIVPPLLDARDLDLLAPSLATGPTALTRTRTHSRAAPSADPSPSARLAALAEACSRAGTSGRALRRLPFLAAAHAGWGGAAMPGDGCDPGGHLIPVEALLDALDHAARRMRREERRVQRLRGA